MKPKFNTSRFRSQTLGASIATLFVCFNFSALAVDNVWNGGSTNWNTTTNWSLGRVPANPNGATSGDTFDDAIVNMTSPANFPVITANTSATPRDVMVGRGSGNVGRIDNSAGTQSYGGWFYIGRNTGTGTYNLANTASSGGGVTGFAQGSGSLSGNRLWVGGTWSAEGTGGSGTLNVNTSGSINCNDLAVGSAGNTGVMNVDSGTVNTSGWNFIGKNEGTTGANGTLTMAGGTLNNTGRTYIGEAGCTGSLNLTGGSYKNNNNEFMVVGGGDAGNGNGTITISNSASLLQSNGELQIADNTGSTGVVDLSNGSITVNNYLAVGRRGGNGTINMSGGTITKTGGGVVTVSTGTNGHGTINQSGGVFTNTTSAVFLGESWNGDGNGTWNLSGTGQAVLGAIIIGNGGAASGTFNLDGGTLTSSKISKNSTGTANFNFNGGTLKPSINEPAFLGGLTATTVKSGGAVIDTNGFNIGIPQSLLDGGGGGGLTKQGSGTLTLTGVNTYTGTTTVNAGKLSLTTAATGGGNVSVANGATLGVTQTGNTSSLNAATVTMGSTGATTLDINLGNIAGNPTAAPLNATSSVTLNGTVTINVADTLPAIGTIPLVSYVAKSGPGSFVLGTLPNGVAATLNESGGVVSLNVTSVSLPRWKGTTDGVNPNSTWDVATTNNWTDMVTGSATTYTDPAPVLFNDDASVLSSTVALGVTVVPSSVTFNNSALAYILTGVGKISGSGSVLKSGTAALSLLTGNNDYTGSTTLQGGTVTVNTLANGGSASSIGASSSGASNLVLTGTTLKYTGASVGIDRGFTIGGGAVTIETANNLATSGAVVNSVGTSSFYKTGAGNLTLSNTGAIALSNGGAGANVNGGTLTLDGSGTQTVSVSGEFWLGSTPNVAANLVLNNTSLNVSSWFAMGRGNGDAGTVCAFTATNSTLSTGNLSTGYNGGLATNDSDQNITLTNTTWTNADRAFLGESQNATTTMVIDGTSAWTNGGRIALGLGNASVATLTIKDSASVVHTGQWVSIGNSSSGTGVLNLQDNATLTSAAGWDFNIADIDTSTGVMNISGNATATIGGILYIAKNANTNGTVNLNGGTLVAKEVREFGLGGGSSTFNFDGGVLKANATGAAADFMRFIDNVVVKSGGGTIDTNGNNLTINESLQDGTGGGGITKIGAGTLYLNGVHNFTGTVQVNAGTLAGTGDYLGAVSVSSGANLNPGATGGALIAETVTFAAGSSLNVDINATAESVEARSVLDISGAALTLNGTPTLPVYVIARYGSLTGTFTSVPVLPSGYTLDYAYNDGFTSNNIAIVQSLTPYQLWAQTNITAIDPLADATDGGDPDGDGIKNIAEYALNGNPLSGVSTGKVVGRVANVGGAPALVLSLPVRIGAVFSGATEQVSATIDGIVYHIQGSDGLSVWDLAVSEVTGEDKTTIETGLPVLDSGWEYRTFQSPGPVAGDPVEFLRAVIVSP